MDHDSTIRKGIPLSGIPPNRAPNETTQLTHTL